MHREAQSVNVSNLVRESGCSKSIDPAEEDELIIWTSELNIWRESTVQVCQQWTGHSCVRIVNG